MLSLNFTVDSSFSRTTAASTEYCLVESTFARMAFCLLVSFAMSSTLHFQAHAARGASNRSYGCVQIGGSQIGHLALGDFFQLRTGYFADLVLVGNAAALGNTSDLAQQNGRGRSLQNECKRT